MISWISVSNLIILSFVKVTAERRKKAVHPLAHTCAHGWRSNTNSPLRLGFVPIYACQAKQTGEAGSIKAVHQPLLVIIPSPAVNYYCLWPCQGSQEMSGGWSSVHHWLKQHICDGVRGPLDMRAEKLDFIRWLSDVQLKSTALCWLGFKPLFE